MYKHFYASKRTILLLRIQDYLRMFKEYYKNVKNTIRSSITIKIQFTDHVVSNQKRQI